MKKFFFLALMAFLWLPATTWADEHEDDPNGDHSGQLDNGDVWDDEQEESLGSIIPSSVQLEYKILSAPVGDIGSMNYENGTVELDNIYAVTEGGTVGALYIPHEIQVVTVEGYTATVNLYTVVAIGENAFRVGEGYSEYNNTITSVSIPYTVTSIGDYAFADNAGINSIVFAVDENGNSDVATIGQYAFYNNSRISTLSLPTTVTSIGQYAFYGCSNITSIVIPDGVTALSTSLFQYCTNLTTVTSSGNITSLGGDVFADCPALTTLIFTSSNPSSRAGGSLLTEDDPFLDDSEDNVTVYVPTGSAAAWEATFWNTLFTNETNVHISWNFFSTSVSASGWDGANTYYATYYVDEEGYILYGGTAYYVSGVSDDAVVTTPITGIIPVNTAILIGSTGAGDYYFYKEYESENEVATITGNMLYGSNEEVETVGPETGVEYYFYKLSRNASGDSGSVGFYWNDDEGGAFTSAAYKAYLAVPQDVANGINYISFKKSEDDTTGISSVENATEKTVSGIYTIQGVRVSNMNQPGLYIVDGKKVLVK